MKRIRLPAVCLVLVAGLAGCQQIGPRALKFANAHYSDAVRVAASEQLLVNLVRLRYRDLPVFLGVSSISTQFEIDASANVSATAVAGSGNDSLGAGSGVRYSERPTITFSIQGGEAFQKRMLQPLQMGAISLVAESGWRVDRVLRLGVEKMNGLKNAPTASGPTPGRAPEYLDFLEATSLMDELEDAGLIDFEYERRYESASAAIPLAQIEGDDFVHAIEAGVEFRASGDGDRLQIVAEKRKLVLRFSPGSTADPRVLRLRDLLRLRPDRRRFPIVSLDQSDFDPFDPEKRLGQLGVDTRSLMGVLYYVANGVEPPQEDLDAGVATATVNQDGSPFEWSALLDGLFRVGSAEKPPPNPAVAARHRGRWFYIADDDETSKTTLALLNSLYALQAGDVQETKPVLTIPVGR